MLEAQWSVEFVSSQGVQGAGSVVFETGRIYGGDAQYLYNGTCEVKGNVLHADVEVTHFAGQPYSVFGPANQVHLKLAGQVTQPVMDLYGYLLEDPSQSIHVRCTKREPLE